MWKLLLILVLILIVVVAFVNIQSIKGGWDYSEISFNSMVHAEENNSKKEGYKLLKNIQGSDKKIVTAESLTGGLMFSSLVDLPFAGWHKYGCFGVYDTDAKRKFLNVTVDDVYTHECAKQMAEGALKNSNANLAIAVTGHAMPMPGDEKELGKVHIGVAKYENGEIITKTKEVQPENKTLELWKTRPETERFLQNQLNTTVENEDVKRITDGYNDIQLTAQIAKFIRFYTTRKAFEFCNEFLLD